LGVLIVVIYFLPLYVLAVMSLKAITDQSSRLSLPVKIFFGNFQRLFGDGAILRALVNSVIVSSVTVLLEVVIASMAAYPLARNRTRLNAVVQGLIIGVMMIPSLSILVGVYSTLVSMHAISTYWGIILVSVAFGLPMPIYFFSNFIVSIPKALDEASVIDGCNSRQSFFYIILPQLKPPMISIIILNGVGMWNEYGYSLYILQRPKMYTLTLMISQYFSSTSANDLNGAAAAACVAIVPVVILYLFLQRYFIQGTVDAAVKG
jgi:raffinose/stachyose/melibiose transport system permease protein